VQLNPHLSFHGECEAAFRFYENCLRGKIVTMITYGDSPAAGQTPPHWREKILHATLAVGEHRLTGADTPDYEKPRGFAVLLNVEDATEADRIFQELAERGCVQMAMQETFWAARFGMLTDRFGTPWIINCGKAA
jgi:PhnB protein